MAQAALLLLPPEAPPPLGSSSSSIETVWPGSSSSKDWLIPPATDGSSSSSASLSGRDLLLFLDFLPATPRACLFLALFLFCCFLSGADTWRVCAAAFALAFFWLQGLQTRHWPVAGFLAAQPHEQPLFCFVSGGLS